MYEAQTDRAQACLHHRIIPSGRRRQESRRPQATKRQQAGMEAWQAEDLGYRSTQTEVRAWLAVRQYGFSVSRVLRERETSKGDGE